MPEVKLNWICSFCNGLELLAQDCPVCFSKMFDGGCLANYLGPYGPYDEADTKNSTQANHCVHLIYCPNCHYDTRVAAKMVAI